MEKKYRHIGYFNDTEDIQELSRVNPDKMIVYYETGCGKFYAIRGIEPDMTQSEIEDEFGKFNTYCEGKYIITIDIENGLRDNFIDIFEEIK